MSDLGVESPVLLLGHGFNLVTITPTNHMTFRNVSTSFLWTSLFEVSDWIQMFLSSAFHTFLLSDWMTKPSIDLQILVYVQSALIFVESLCDSELNCPYRASSLFCLFVCFVLLCFLPLFYTICQTVYNRFFVLFFISVNTPEWNLILFFFFLRQQSIWKEETEVYNDVCVVN